MAGLGSKLNLKQEEEKFMQERLNMQARNPVSSKSTKVFGDGLKNEDQNIEENSRLNSNSALASIQPSALALHSNSESYLQESRQKIRESVQN